mmetsp:Transcript_92105/g.159906  ORF Transcript_92105/g.159906 Transcript_92105/m.159906 type:complete len:250 (-) Transcript_92105:53-802(-)
MLSSAAVELDDVCLMRLLQYVNQPVARLCCRHWADYLFDSLRLEPLIRFQKAVSAASEGCLSYHHSTVHDLGGMEECVSFTFSFSADQHYTLHWFREGLTSDNEQQYGAWHVVGDEVECTTLTSLEEVDDRYLRFADAGRMFSVPVSDILQGTTKSDNKLLGWELTARGLARKPNFPGLSESVAVDSEVSLQELQSRAAQPVRVNARYVEIDEEMHEVHQDIIENWAESDWVRLMRCRLRFGSGRERWA